MKDSKKQTFFSAFSGSVAPRACFNVDVNTLLMLRNQPRPDRIEDAEFPGHTVGV